MFAILIFSTALVPIASAQQEALEAVQPAAEKKEPEKQTDDEKTKTAEQKAKEAAAKAKLSRLLGNAIKDLFQPRRVAPQAIIQPQPPPLAPNEQKVRKQRLEYFAAAQTKWIDQICDLTEEQHEELDQLISKQVVQSKRVNNQRQQRGFSDYAPVCFTLDGAAAKDFGDAWNSKVRDILNEQQHNQLETAEAERQRAMLLARRNRVVNLMDAELFFTPEQRKKVEEHVDRRLSGKSPKLYSMMPQTYYLPYQSMQTLFLGLDKEVLNEAQKKRLERLKRYNQSGPDSERYITFMSNDGVDSWYDTLDDAVKKQGLRLEEAANVRVEFFKSQNDLQPEQLKHLKTATKGTLLYCIGDWKKTSKEQLKQWEERMKQQQFANGNFGFSVAVPSTSQFEQHELWKRTLTQMNVDTHSAFAEREQQLKAGKVGYVASLLDEELWFTPEQREQFTKKLASKMPRSETQGYEYMYEILLVAIPLSRFTDKEIKSILSPEQMQAWNTLKGQYQFNGRNVSINMQNMGNFSFYIPD